MPVNTPRVEVYFKSSETRRRLELYRLELAEKTGKRFSKSQLIETIVEQFLDKNGISSSNEKKTS
jgi:hypothetical protein